MEMCRVVRLFVEGGDEGGVAVAEGVDGDAACEVDVFAPFGVPHAAAEGAVGDDGGEGEVGREVVLHGLFLCLTFGLGGFGRLKSVFQTAFLYALAEGACHAVSWFWPSAKRFCPP